MIVVLKHNVQEEKKDQLIDWLRGQGLTVHISRGDYQTVLGLVGDTSKVDMDLIGSLGIVDSVKRITDPFKKSNRKFHPGDTIVEVGGARNVYACASHGLLSGPAIERLEESHIKELALLNTLPTNLGEGCSKVKYLSVAPMFAEAIERIYQEISIAKLFN